MEAVLQGFMEGAVAAATPRMAASLRKVLAAFHDQKAQPGVDAFLLRMWRPFLFRALQAANAGVRKNAVGILTDAFPLCDPEAPAEETDALRAQQVTALYELMMDPCPAVREAAVGGAATVLDRFWELIPTVTAARYVARIVDDLAFDKASGAVRAAAVEALALLVENALAQPLLKAVLPRVAPLLADMSPRVRGAVADLLLAVRGVRAIRFYEVVPVETLLKALGARCVA